MRLLFAAAWLAAGSLSCPGTAAAAGPQNDDLASVVKRIEAAYRNTKELQTDFVQTTQYQGFETPYISKGRLYIRRPDKMRWDYREPSTHQIYVNGDTVIYLVPEHQQAIRSSMDREVHTPVPLMLLAGAATLSEQFNIVWEGAPGKTKGAYRLRLTGKGAGASLAPITIEAAADTFLIRRAVLHDPSGAETTFDFSHLQLNGGLDDKLFVFTPPAGIEVVDAPPLLPPNAAEPKSGLPGPPMRPPDE
ncbi:MAG TPA: outer membrane lipoprotein carrier protein LolA [Nitrospiria bacterium]|nr:outer membrane lipoprotein carrier protein LolA [Nitrospiria bacterium]